METNASFDIGFLSIVESFGIDPHDHLSHKVLIAVLSWTRELYMRLLSDKYVWSPIFLGEEYDDYVANLLKISEQFHYSLQANELIHTFRSVTMDSWKTYLVEKWFYNSVLKKWDDLHTWKTTLNILRRSSLFDDLLNNGTGILWTYSYARAEKSGITLDIGEMMLSHSNLILDGHMDVTMEQLFMCVFCHELAHLFSTESPTREELDTSYRLYELRRSVLWSDQPDEDIFYLTKYRSGIYLDSVWSDADLKLNLINEAITELIAEEVYNHIWWVNPTIIGRSYIYTYKKEVESLRKALVDISGEMGQSYNVIWEKIRRWYFLWWEDFTYVLVEIIDKIYSRFCANIDI